jgi:ABC-type transport system substrate-binding protein
MSIKVIHKGRQYVQPDVVYYFVRLKYDGPGSLPHKYRCGTEKGATPKLYTLGSAKQVCKADEEIVRVTSMGMTVIDYETEKKMDYPKK